MPQSFSIDGVNWPARVVFTWHVTPVGLSEPYLGVRLEYTQLSASWFIDRRLDVNAFVEFFSNLARHRDEDLEALSVHSLDSDLTISASQSWDGERRQVDLIFKLACDTQDPYWTTELRVNVEKGQLDKLAADAAAFFIAVGAG